MRNILNLSTNKILFNILMTLTPAVFVGMLAGSGSLLAAAAVAVAYASVLVGEKMGD